MNCVESYFKNDFSQSDKIALAFLSANTTKTSFKELSYYCIQAQKYYKQSGLTRGDTVLIFEPLSAELYAMIIGALGLGISLLVVEPWMKASNVNKVIEKSNPKAIITGLLGKLVSAKFHAIREIAVILNSQKIHQFQVSKADQIECTDMSDEDNALIAYTSGTSGVSKGVRRTHRYLIDQTNVIEKYVHYEKFPKLDLTIFTNMVLLNLNLGKGSLIVQKPWKKKSYELIDNLSGDLEVDTLACGPAFLNNLIEKTSKLKLGQIYTGGALADIEIHKLALKRWSKADLYHVYGSSEAEPVSVVDLSESVKKSEKAGHFKNLYLGSPIDEINWNIKHDELWVSGSHVSPSYLNDEQANLRLKQIDINNNTWHNMGDRVDIDNNNFWYQGRGFQQRRSFKLEQDVYKILGHSRAFIWVENDKTILFGDNIECRSKEIHKHFPEIENVYDRSIIVDDRHRSRINREESFYKGVTMKNIMMFMIKRVPLIANIILVWGLIRSVEVLNAVEFSHDAFWYSMISLVIFITELRFMDELKDFEKDKIAHPTRPLPSGLVTTRQVTAMVNIGLLSMIICSIMGFILLGMSSGILMSLVTGWLYLMYKEFFIGESLSKSPLLYAITHQVIIIPATLMLISLQGDNQLLFTKQSLGFSFFILGCFFSFEVGRKMNPKSHPVLETYYLVYGKIKAHLLLLSLLSMALVSSFLFDGACWSIPAVGFVLLIQLMIYFKEDKFKVMEGVVSLFLIYAVWMLPLMDWLL